MVTRGRRGHNRIDVGFTTTCAISAYHASLKLCEVCSIQHYVIKFVSDLRQVGGLFWVLWFTDRHNITEILLKVALNTINQTYTSKKGN